MICVHDWQEALLWIGWIFFKTFIPLSSLWPIHFSPVFSVLAPLSSSFLFPSHSLHLTSFPFQKLLSPLQFLSYFILFFLFCVLVSLTFSALLFTIHFSGVWSLFLECPLICELRNAILTSIILKQWAWSLSLLSLKSVGAAGAEQIWKSGHFYLWA